jgi:hypothetical protein
LPPSENSPQCHDCPTNDSLLNCSTGKANPLQGIPEIGKYWNNLTNTDPEWWRASDGLFCVCGKLVHTKPPRTWKGSCTTGVIQPGFFLLPNLQGEQQEAPLYETLGPRIKRDLEVGGQQRWGADKWPPQRRQPGPATWAQDGSWGYPTPIYMFNRIIRL